MLVGRWCCDHDLGLVRTKESIWGGNRAGIDRFWERPEIRFMHRTERGLHEEAVRTHELLRHAVSGVTARMADPRARRRCPRASSR